MTPELTILNGMASPDFEVSLDRQRDWGIRWLDLKDRIVGRSLLDLTDTEAGRAAAMIARRGMEVYCLSSGLFHSDIERGRETFTSGLRTGVARLVELARILSPQVIRLLGATTSRREQTRDAVEETAQRHPWLIEEYQRAIDAIGQAGFMATIENEVGGCILSTPTEVKHLLQLIDRPQTVMFTWDVQNLWQAGTYPTIAVYDELRDLTGYVHLKGGQTATPGGPLEWRCALEDASFDVRAIVRRVMASDRVPVICLNPPHGQTKPGYDYANLVDRDLQYLRQCIRVPEPTSTPQA